MRKGLLGLQRKRLEDFKPKNTCKLWLWHRVIIFPSSTATDISTSAALPTALMTGDHEVNWGKQSCTSVPNALLTSLFGCTCTFYFRGNSGSHGGMLPSQWEAGLLVSVHKKSQSAADAFAQVCGSTAGTGTPVRSDQVTYFAHTK